MRIVKINDNTATVQSYDVDDNDLEIERCGGSVVISKVSDQRIISSVSTKSAPAVVRFLGACLAGEDIPRLVFHTREDGSLQIEAGIASRVFE